MGRQIHHRPVVSVGLVGGDRLVGVIGEPYVEAVLPTRVEGERAGDEFGQVHHHRVALVADACDQFRLVFDVEVAAAGIGRWLAARLQVKGGGPIADRIARGAREAQVHGKAVRDVDRGLDGLAAAGGDRVQAQGLVGPE